MKIGSLCTGYGGLDMAVEAYFDAETVWTCEFDKHASKIIEERIGKHNYGDLKLTDWSKVEPIDILTAGYPCQPFSQAGLRKGANDDRHLWPYIKEIVRQLRPSYIVLENVRGHFGLGFREVLSDLTSIGYDARWTLIRASDVGAPHRRERLFIVAYPNSTRWPQTDSSGLQEEQSGDSCSNDYLSTSDTDSDTCKKSRGTNRKLRTASPRLRARQNERKAGAKSRFSLEMEKEAIPAPLDQGQLDVKFVEYMMGLPNGWVSEIDIPRSQQLKILGNGVVPQQAFRALELLLND